MFSLANGLSIQIGTLPPITFCHEVEIESAWAKFTDTATVTLPRNVRVLGPTPLQDLINVGDPITISYGYDGNIRLEFTGYVSALGPGTPFKIKCEDQMWQLKRLALPSMSWRSVTLLQLLQYIRANSGLDFPIRELGNLVVGKYLINQATGAQVFDNLKKRFGMSFFFRQGALWAGKPYDNTTAKTYNYAFRQNVIESDLVFSRATDIAIHFRAVSTQANGQKLQVDRSGIVKAKRVKGQTGVDVTAFSTGIAKGELRTLIAAPGLNKAQLTAWLTRQAAQLQFDGYRGGLTSFNLPTADHGDIALVSDPDYPERSGSYYIDSVKKTWGVNGSRRILKLGPKAGNPNLTL